VLPAQEILEAARQLPREERDELVELLRIEDKPEPPAAAKAAWDAKIKRRLDEIDSGKMK
jgi:hypothetical protein